MKRLLFVFSWILTTTITLISALTVYQTTTRTPGLPGLVAHELRSFAGSPNAYTAYAALPASVSEISLAVKAADARPVTIDAYLSTYNSPLSGYGQVIVDTADKYSLDPYLIVAIAQQESNLCKVIPAGSYNCWGWGIHSEGTLKFSSFDQAIEEYTRGLRERYFDHGYDTPEKIMVKYTPLSDGSWASGVNQFIAELNSGNF